MIAARPNGAPYRAPFFGEAPQAISALIGLGRQNARVRRTSLFLHGVSDREKNVLYR